MMMNVCGQAGPGTRRTPSVSPTSMSPTSSTCTAKRTTSTSACHTSLLTGQLCHLYSHMNLGTVGTGTFRSVLVDQTVLNISQMLF